eukprot:CCRYP_012533-RA/>CCRYP_012533-RA protein AED:0.31 eAED:0.29 QI:0/0/0/0.66/0/0/3/0/253
MVLTRLRIKPQQKKVQAILAISLSKNVKDLPKFLGMVQYYRDFWARCSEVLVPLTSLVQECGHTKVTRIIKTKKCQWYWDTVHQKAFDDVKTTIATDVVLAYPDYSREFEIYTDAISLVGECGHTKVTRAKSMILGHAFDDVKTTIAKDVVLAYPDCSREFEIYTDASSKQLGAVITQGNRPLAVFSRKLLTVRHKYSVTKLELLTIVETLKEFKVGAKIEDLYTPQKSNPGCTGINLGPCLPMGIAPQQIWS